MDKKEASGRATDRKLLFINLVNGVSIPEVARAFHKNSDAEVMADFKFVSLKIRSYIFQRAMPYLPCDTIEEAKQNRIVFFGILDKLNLDVVPAFSKITAAKVEDIYA